MTSRKELLDQASDRVTAHELGAQLANELIMRAILHALETLAKDDGPSLVAAIEGTVEAAIAESKLDGEELTEIFRTSARIVTDSVFSGMRKPYPTT